MSKPLCPNCKKSEHLHIEKRIDGNAVCVGGCGWQGRYSECTLSTDAQENGVKRWEPVISLHCISGREFASVEEIEVGDYVRYVDHLAEMQKKDAEIKTHTSNFKEMHNAYFDARKTIAELKTECERLRSVRKRQVGMLVRSIALRDEEGRQKDAVNEKLAKTIEESKAVWDAAYVEGLPEAMNEARAGNSAKLLDLLDRRLLFALAPLVYAELEKAGQE